MLKVGQVLYWVPRERYGKKEGDVTVEKVGRKWATLSNGERIDINTLCADMDYRGIIGGRCHLDKNALLAEREKNRLWRALWGVNRAYLSIPEGITTDDIRQAAALLKINLS